MGEGSHPMEFTPLRSELQMPTEHFKQNLYPAHSYEPDYPNFVDYGMNPMFRLYSYQTAPYHEALGASFEEGQQSPFSPSANLEHNNKEDPMEQSLVPMPNLRLRSQSYQVHQSFSLAAPETLSKLDMPVCDDDYCFERPQYYQQDEELQQRMEDLRFDQFLN